MLLARSRERATVAKLHEAYRSNLLADDINLPAIVQISWEGQVIRKEIIKDLLVRSDDNTVFTHYVHNNSIDAIALFAS